MTDSQWAFLNYERSFNILYGCNQQSLRLYSLLVYRKLKTKTSLIIRQRALNTILSS